MGRVLCESKATDSPPHGGWDLSAQLLSLAATPGVLKGHSIRGVGGHRKWGAPGGWTGTTRLHPPGCGEGELASGGLGPPQLLTRDMRALRGQWGDGKAEGFYSPFQC